MGGEGSMMAANNSLKNNRNLVAKRKEEKALSGSYANMNLAKFPKATTEDLERIKRKIQSDNKQLRRKQITIFGIIIVILVSFIFYFKS